jgi:hypothetical protein
MSLGKERAIVTRAAVAAAKERAESLRAIVADVHSSGITSVRDITMSP